MVFLVNQDVQSSEPLEPYLTSVREIEGITGLNFNPLFVQAYADSIEGVELEEVW